jgi:membrane protein YdbS with pleckstrin-like domain
MRCRQCDRDVPAESVFCPQCGTRLNGGAPDAGNPVPAAPPSPAVARSVGKMPEEVDLWAGTYSPKAMIGTYVAMAALTLAGIVAAVILGPWGWALLAVAFVAWAFVLALLFYRRLTVRYRLTTYRFFHDTGLLARIGNRIQVIDINDVVVQQGPIERMLGLGTIVIEASDKSNPQLRLLGIENVRHVADLIDGARRAERNRRGLYVFDDAQHN